MNPIFTRQPVRDNNNSLPFLEISLHQAHPHNDYSGAFSFALLDSGSTRNIINQTFYDRYFSRSTLKSTNIILKYAAEGTGRKVKYFAELFISITVDKGTIILCQPFLIVPDIRFDVYLGQTFISSKDFYMYHPKFVLFTFPQKQEIMFQKDNVLLDSRDTLKASLRYLSKDTYKEATERAKNQNNHIKNFTQRNQTSAGSPSDAHPTKFYSTFDRHSDAKIQNISALHNIQNINSEENYYGISNSNIDREFQKEMNRFNIEPDAQEELWNSYQRYGKALIPISNLKSRRASSVAQCISSPCK